MTRPPRYRFPNEVRDATREAASRMMAAGMVATTPEELEAWLAQAPELRATLEKGGYGTEFDATELFPLLQAMTGQEPESTPAITPDRAPASPSFGQWVAICGALVLVIVVVLIALGVDILP